MSLITKGFIARGVIITKGLGGETLIPPDVRPEIVGITDIEQAVVSARMVASPGTIGGLNGQRPRPVKGPTPTRPLYYILNVLLRWLAYG